MRSGVPSSRITRPEPSICIASGWVLEPANFKSLSVKRAGLNGGAVVVRNELSLRIAAADTRTLIWECVRSDLVARYYQVMRTPIDWDVEFWTWKARTLDDRLVIAG